MRRGGGSPRFEVQSVQSARCSQLDQVLNDCMVDVFDRLVSSTPSHTHDRCCRQGWGGGSTKIFNQNLETASERLHALPSRPRMLQACPFLQQPQL